MSMWWMSYNPGDHVMSFKIMLLSVNTKKYSATNIEVMGKTSHLVLVKIPGKKILFRLLGIERYFNHHLDVIWLLFTFSSSGSRAPVKSFLLLSDFVKHVQILSRSFTKILTRYVFVKKSWADLCLKLSQPFSNFVKLVQILTRYLSINPEQIFLKLSQ